MEPSHQSYVLVPLTAGKSALQRQGHPRTGHEGPEGEKRYSSTLYLTSALGGVGGERHAPAALPLVRKPGTHCTEGWVGPRTGLDGCGKSRPPTETRSPDRPTHSESLYRLRYPCRRSLLYPLHYIWYNPDPVWVMQRRETFVSWHNSGRQSQVSH